MCPEALEGYRRGESRHPPHPPTNKDNDRSCLHVRDLSPVIRSDKSKPAAHLSSLVVTITAAAGSEKHRVKTGKHGRQHRFPPCVELTISIF